MFSHSGRLYFKSIYFATHFLMAFLWNLIKNAPWHILYGIIKKRAAKTGFTLVCYSFRYYYISCFKKSQTKKSPVGNRNSGYWFTGRHFGNRHSHSPLQRLNIQSRKPSRCHAIVGNVTDLHIIVHIKRNRYNIRSVQFLIDDTAADRIPIQPDQKIKQGRAVGQQWQLS